MRKLAVFAFSFAAAVFLCNYALASHLRLYAGGLCGVIFLAALAILRKKRRLFVGLFCAGLALGFLWSEVYDRVFFSPARALDDTTIRLSAVVTDYPKKRDYGSWQVPARMKTQRGTTLDLILYTDDQGAELRPGDEISSVTHCTVATRSSAGEEIT